MYIYVWFIVYNESKKCIVVGIQKDKEIWLVRLKKLHINQSIRFN